MQGHHAVAGDAPKDGPQALGQAQAHAALDVQLQEGEHRGGGQGCRLAAAAQGQAATCSCGTGPNPLAASASAPAPAPLLGAHPPAHPRATHLHMLCQIGSVQRQDEASQGAQHAPAVISHTLRRPPPPPLTPATVPRAGPMPLAAGCARSSAAAPPLGLSGGGGSRSTELCLQPQQQNGDNAFSTSSAKVAAHVQTSSAAFRTSDYGRQRLRLAHAAGWHP